jgi:hypothetical protein
MCHHTPFLVPPVLPDAVILYILALNSSPTGSSIARQVNRDAHEDGVRRSGRCKLDIPAFEPDLPVWLLQQMWPNTHSFFQPKLLEARCALALYTSTDQSTTAMLTGKHYKCVAVFSRR